MLCYFEYVLKKVPTAWKRWEFEKKKWEKRRKRDVSEYTDNLLVKDQLEFRGWGVQDEVEKIWGMAQGMQAGKEIEDDYKKNIKKNEGNIAQMELNNTRLLINPELGTR